MSAQNRSSRLPGRSAARPRTDRPPSTGPKREGCVQTAATPGHGGGGRRAPQVRPSSLGGVTTTLAALAIEWRCTPAPTAEEPDKSTPAQRQAHAR
eukprot:scaffold1065_cov406-Prasinococcus_capsulatus_cf.AAC.10